MLFGVPGAHPVPCRWPRIQSRPWTPVGMGLGFPSGRYSPQRVGYQEPASDPDMNSSLNATIIPPTGDPPFSSLSSQLVTNVLSKPQDSTLMGH